MRSWVKLLFVVYLLHPCEEEGLSAETVFVQKGHDVLLDVTDAEGVEEFIVLTWRFNGNVNLVAFVAGQKEIVSQKYTKRIEFFAKNYSLVLKNLQEEDSGDYVARVIKTTTEEEVTEHKVIVKDPVSPVVLTGHSVSRSSDSCNFTVTCTTRDSHINSTFRCDGQTCSQEGGERTEVPVSGASLQVHLSNDSITCNHSNQVSWTKDSNLTEHFCPQLPGPQPIHFIVPVVVCIVILFLILILFVAFLYYARKRKYRRERKVRNEAQPVDQSPTDNASESCDPSPSAPLASRDTSP